MLLRVVRSATLVHDFLRCSAERVPGKVALISDERRLTYGEVAAAAARLANALRTFGLRRGGRVAIDLCDGPELIISIFGVLQAGGAFVLINDEIPRAKLDRILDDCQATMLIISAGRLEWAERLAADVPSLKTVILSPRHPGRPDLLPCLSFETIQDQFSANDWTSGSIDRDLACLAYTCLLNGDPRGAMLDHSNVVFVTHSLVQCLEATEDDRVLLMSPISELGLYPLLGAFSLGATVELAGGSPDPAGLLERVARDGITVLAASAPVLAKLLRVDLKNYDLSSLRCIASLTDTPCLPLMAPLQETLPGVRLVSLQSFPESQVALYALPSDVDRGAGCAGVAIPGTEAWIEDAYGKVLEPGQAGELVLRGRHVMRGYWGDPAATAARQRPGRLPGEQVCYTGDLYKADHDGYLHFVAHRDEVLYNCGHRVVPAAVEDVLYQLPGVLEAAVAGVPESSGEQTLKAFVVAGNDDLTAACILDHCRANLEPYMVPGCVEIRHELPTAAFGKVVKSGLL